jgi:hypothetical protein
MTVAALIAGLLRDPLCRFSIGSFGAVAEFVRAEDEPVTFDGLSAVTPRGAIRFGDLSTVRPIAFETGFADGWSHGIALCVPAETRPPAPQGIDLGLGLSHVTAESRGDHVVFACAFAEIEVMVDRPDGPRVVIAPAVARRGRTHAATDPIPAGLVPSARITPPHPVTEASFDARRHADFQSILARFGDPAHLAMKDRVFAALQAGAPLPQADSRAARNSLRVALRQWEWLSIATPTWPGLSRPSTPSLLSNR